MAALHRWHREEMKSCRHRRRCKVEAEDQEHATDLAMGSLAVDQRLYHRRLRCRARALEEEREYAAAGRYRRAALKLCLHRQLLRAEVAELETQPAARAAVWDR